MRYFGQRLGNKTRISKGKQVTKKGKNVAR